MPTAGDSHETRRLTLFTPGTGIAVIGDDIVLFLPEAAATARLQQLADLVTSGPGVTVRDIVDIVERSPAGSTPAFVVLHHTMQGVTLFVRGDVPVTVTRTDDGHVELLGESDLEHRMTGSHTVRVGAPHSPLVYRASGAAVLPAAGVVTGFEEVRVVLGDAVAAHPNADEAATPRRAPEPIELAPVDSVSTEPTSAEPVPAEPIAVEPVPIELAEPASLDEPASTPPPARPPVSMSISELFDDPPAAATHAAVEPESAADDVAPRWSPPSVAGSTMHATTEDVVEDEPDTDDNSTSRGDHLARAALEHGIIRVQDEMSVGRAAQATNSSSVRGHTCNRGHLNPPGATSCVVCRSPLDTEDALQSGPRPRLGSLVFDDGITVQLDRPVTIGRMPPANEMVGGEVAQPVIIDDPTLRVSSYHVLVRFQGWQVVVEDQGSTNRTWAIAPDDDSTRTTLAPHVPTAIAPGTTVNMGGKRTFTYRYS